MPSVVTTSDAGNGVGYTGIRVRGSDATRVNVTINGVPYNDSESHGTFWVNMPDFASSVQSLQLQRGIGTSTNGAGAFGASLNVLTDSYATVAGGEISNSYGSFNTRKHTVKFTTGLLNDNFEIAGRLSNIASDGYIDRATTDLKSYFLQGTYAGKTSLIKALVFGGTERTYQAWNGVDAETMYHNRTFNSAGIYTDEAGQTRYYDNETDNYAQDHYQLHWNERISESWESNVALHYTKGRGYFENYKEDGYFEDYNINYPGPETSTDLVRRKWLDNDFYGLTFSGRYKADALDIMLGGGWNRYDGDHFGEVVWARLAGDMEPGDRYYNDFARKTDGNVFAKVTYRLNTKISLYGDLQYRRVRYMADGVQPTLVDDTFNFVNPKGGLTYKLNDNNSLYLSYARASREPNRTDYEGGNVKPETMDDIELGWRFVNSRMSSNINFYYMSYNDQLILTGALDDVGGPVRSNSEKSFRLGLEADLAFDVSDQVTIRPNFTLSTNRNIDLNIDGTDYGTTEIAYSPSIIAANMIIYRPVKSVRVSLLSKFVGDQYMNNMESDYAKLQDYFVNDLNVAWEIPMKNTFRSIVVTALLNNILDKKYVSNGYMYDIYPYYYPQAGINGMIGLSLLF
jgi:iron complex outermembrane receptor protein